MPESFDRSRETGDEKSGADCEYGLNGHSISRIILRLFHFYTWVLEGAAYMYLTMLKAKLHNARVTHSELEYDGSCAIDASLLQATDIREYEQIQVYNVTNGERFTTYVILGEEGSGIISVNGAAAHKANPGDRVIICAYAGMDRNEVARFKPTIAYLDEQNRIIRMRNAIPLQAA
uniref:Aspartate 1-decarboxylase n=1 Tax=Candidatus Kentrum sp. TC TaxID=2126339 RepID=A0A450ZE47_9GAMM|nr:MAG: aspartate 1-decarboxylase [Candidatus Kentron sp. TC]VFK52044.1 MAG: L-aspartate 1-decarboxylase [Candidatus Kentron sp. TC]VFK64394.1 MAG: aspartate 1-decarboxylase [Candidatus Kentron sp. TC]